jgi:hypothetical protein
MLKRVLLTVALLGLLFYGLTHLFLMRFRSGDVFPPYTSLRTDPLGAQGFHDALAALPDLEVRRNYRPIEKLDRSKPTTLIYAGTPHGARWREAEWRAVQAIIRDGARVVITFLPVNRAPSKRETQESKDDAEEADPLPLLPFREVASQLGFAFDYLKDDEEEVRTAHSGDPALALEPAISWHSVLSFKIKDSAWRTIYSSAEQPVIIERPFGKGSIVLAADSYFLSNEALRKERASQLLAWLVGSSQAVVFDEESHGLSESPGIATLVRRYRLHLVAVVLLILAALFVWRNASPLVPPDADSDLDGDVVLGNESGAGFTNLLRRSIPPAKILDTCVAEWRKSLHTDGDQKQAAVVEELLATERTKPARERRPVATYRAISAALRRK